MPPSATLFDRGRRDSAAPGAQIRTSLQSNPQVRALRPDQASQSDKSQVSLGAFEHCADGAGDAGYKRYGTFFKKFYDLMPDDGRMLLHTIVVPNAEGQELYDIYMHYLTGCSDLFRDHYIDVCQFTPVK
jgi:cyclopropane fatty-acyl-phospholipid synthase-like methyltransferase